MNNAFKTTRFPSSIATIALIASLMVIGYEAQAEENTPVTLLPALNGPEITIASMEIQSPIEAGATKTIRMARGFAGEAQARDLAAKLFETCEQPQEVVFKSDMDGSKLIYVGAPDASAYFQIDTLTGDFSFSKGLAAYDGEGNTPGLPKRAAAVRLALRHLEALDLLPADKNQLYVQHVGGMRQAVVREDGSTDDFDKLVTVSFGRKIDGVEVSGPGSKIVVHLGIFGELVGLHRRWIEGEAVTLDETAFVSTGEALRRVADHLVNEWSEAQRVDAATPGVGYFDDGNGLIEPAYFFTAKLSYDPTIHDFARIEGYTNTYLGVVPALQAPKAKFRQLEPALLQPATAPAEGTGRSVEATGNDE